MEGERETTREGVYVCVRERERNRSRYKKTGRQREIKLVR